MAEKWVVFHTMLDVDYVIISFFLDGVRKDHRRFGECTLAVKRVRCQHHMDTCMLLQVFRTVRDF